MGNQWPEYPVKSNYCPQLKDHPLTLNHSELLLLTVFKISFVLNDDPDLVFLVSADQENQPF